MWQKNKQEPKSEITGAQPQAPLTMLSKLENNLAAKEREIVYLQAEAQKLREGISLLKWRPEAEAILEAISMRFPKC